MWRVIGQEALVSFLERGLGQGRLFHAYLLVGPPGIGKGTLALDFARALNCLQPQPPCGGCPSCLAIAAGIHPDVLWLVRLRDERTGRKRTEIGIDQVREACSLAVLPPYQGRYKLFILDGAELLSAEAGNALLKTLEEPPPQVVFLLLAAAEEAVLPTLVSRCLRLELRPVPEGELARFLVERGLPAGEARFLARLSQGRPGRVLAEGFLERRVQTLSRLEESLFSGWGERAALAAELAGRYERERDLEALILWQEWWRDLFLVKAGLPEGVVHADRRPLLERCAGSLSLSQMRSALASLRSTVAALRHNANPRLALEVLMFSLPHMEDNGGSNSFSPPQEGGQGS